MLMRVATKGSLWFFCLSIALFSLTVVALVTSLGFSSAAPHLLHYATDHRVPLFAHMICASVALLLMPFQFWAGLRGRWPSLHRISGRIYAASVLFAAVGSLLLLPRFQGSIWAAIGFGALAVLWVITTGRAVAMARAGMIASHRAWILRSAALTFAAVVLRLMTLPLMAAGMTLTESYSITAWASWLVPLSLVEWRLLKSRSFRLRAARADRSTLGLY